MLVGKSLQLAYIEQNEACEWTTPRHVLGRWILKTGSSRIGPLPFRVGDRLNFGL
jgi:hypothetical protein